MEVEMKIKIRIAQRYVVTYKVSMQFKTKQVDGNTIALSSGSVGEH